MARDATVAEVRTAVRRLRLEVAAIQRAHPEGHPAADFWLVVPVPRAGGQGTGGVGSLPGYVCGGMGGDHEAHAAPARPTFDPAAAARLDITDRQAEVLRLVLQGLSNKQICRVLDLAEPTVKVHVSALLRALDVKSRTQLVLAAASRGIIPVAAMRAIPGEG